MNARGRFWESMLVIVLGSMAFSYCISLAAEPSAPPEQAPAAPASVTCEPKPLSNDTLRAIEYLVGQQHDDVVANGRADS